MSQDIRDRWNNAEVDKAAQLVWQNATGQNGQKLKGAEERDFVNGMVALLTGAPPPPPKTHEYTLRVDGIPSREYLDALIDQVAANDCEFAKVGPEWKIVGKASRLSEDLRKSLKEHKPFILDRLRERYPDKYPALGPPMPEPGRLVEWVAPDDHLANPETPTRGRFCYLDKLMNVDWLRWRYMGTEIWYYPSGYKEEEL